MAVTTTDDFIEAIRKCGLLSSKQLDEASEAAQGLSEPTAVARELVRRKLLSRWQAGKILANKMPAYLGKYKLLDLLGSGGMGPVYLAEHEQMERRVVLKTIVPSEDSNEESNGQSTSQFLAEARTIASLDHRNLIHVYDVDREGDSYCLVMEHVEGEDLQTVVDRDGPLSPWAAANVIAMAASGLADAHAHGIFHHGIKPDRLLMREEGDLKILDVGMARLSDPNEATIARTASKVSAGDVDYLAPEQATGRNKVDQRSDIYSLGATFFFLLTGHAPYPKGTDEERLKARLRKVPPSVLSDSPKTPKSLAELCSQMMATQPRERTSDAEEVADQLRQWLKKNERPAGARPPRPSKKRSESSDSDLGDSDSSDLNLSDLDLADLTVKDPMASSGVGSTARLVTSKKSSTKPKSEGKSKEKSDEEPDGEPDEDAAKTRSPMLLGVMVGGGGVLVLGVIGAVLAYVFWSDVSLTAPPRTAASPTAPGVASDPPAIGGLVIRSASATGGVKLEPHPESDGSYRVDGAVNPDRATYTIVATTKVPEITGFRLELLDDISFPQGGPGRAEEGGFSVTELEVYASPDANFFATHRQRIGQADSETGSGSDPASHAADRNIATSWVVATPEGEPKTIDFVLQQPIVVEQINSDDGVAWIKLVMHQELGNKYTIGRFRWTALTDVETTGLRTVPAILETNPTVAYWRFEEGEASKEVASVAGASKATAAVDSSGNNNHLYATTSSFAPQSVARDAGDVVSSDEPNTLALDTTAAPGRGAKARFVTTDAMRSRPEVDIERVRWDRWTIEASFRLPKLSERHVILAKGGKPTSQSAPPLQLAVDGELKRISLTLVDADGAQQQIATDPKKFKLVANRWYNVVAICDGKTLELLVNDPVTGRGLDVQATKPLEKPLVDSVGRWHVGCGFFDGAPSGRSRLHIDEVRVSADALSADQFLFPKSDGSEKSADPNGGLPETPIAFQSLTLSKATSGQGVKFSPKTDGSYVVGGTSYDKITYAIEASTDVPNITGFRLEVLADPSLPGSGPGRHEDAPNEGKLAITQFKVVMSDAAKGSKWSTVRFAKAQASVGDATVDRAIDGDAATAWVVDQRLGKSHWIVFETESPIRFSGKTWFKINVHHALGGKASTGRFRLSLRTGSTDGEWPGAQLSSEKKRGHRFEKTASVVDSAELFASEQVGRQSFELGSVYLEENDSLDVALLGGAEGHGAKGSFSLAKADAVDGVDEGWDVTYAPEAGSAVTLGHLVRNNQDLTLQWEPPGDQDPGVKSFFNGVLKFTVAGATHHVTLREPIVSQPLAYSLDRRRRDTGPARVRILLPPDIGALRVQIRPDPKVFEGITFDPEDTMPLADGVSTILMGIEGRVVLKVDAAWNARESVAEVTARAFYRSPPVAKTAGAADGKKPRRVRKSKRDAPFPFAKLKSMHIEKDRLEREDRSLTRALAINKKASRYKAHLSDGGKANSEKGRQLALTPAEQRDWLQVRGLTKEMVDRRQLAIRAEIGRLDTLIKQTAWLVPASDGPPIAIDLRIFRVVEGAELDLVRTTGWSSD